jgi:2',3'-cyclic-nucleotide 2'-phosphodiesterase (5'-nucleotidase family)
MISSSRASSVRSASALAVLVLVGLRSVLAGERPQDPARERTAVILAINDVYRIEGLEQGALGGLARVRTLRKELERDAPDLLVLHGGDFLFPSFASRMYRGEQMISVMNALDGDAQAMDTRMFVTFGNHEFDRPRLRDAPGLLDRIETSQFRWLGGNITFKKGAEGSPIIASKKLSRTAIVESGGLRIGIFGLTIPTLGVDYIADFAGEQAAARELTAELRSQGVDVVVALTHLNAANDRALLDTLGAAGPDLIIGGHDHEAMTQDVKGRWLLKADADARSATVVRVTKTADGGLRVKHELRKMAGSSPAPDTATQSLVDDWQSRHAKAFCAESKEGPACLDEVYGRTRTDLEAEENKIRGSETSLGDFVTDRMLDAFKECGAQVAFVNSGSLRINRDLMKGTTITRRHVEELFAYPTPLHLLKLDGATMAKVADQSVRGWPGSGTWLQIAGFAYRHDTARRTASSLTWISPSKARPMAATDTVLAVASDYVVNPTVGDQDGYLMLNQSQIVPSCPADGVDLKAVVIKALKVAEPKGIAPQVQGRICQGVSGKPCLVPAR